MEKVYVPVLARLNFALLVRVGNVNVINFRSCRLTPTATIAIMITSISDVFFVASSGCKVVSGALASRNCRNQKPGYGDGYQFNRHVRSPEPRIRQNGWNSDISCNNRIATLIGFSCHDHHGLPGPGSPGRCSPVPLPITVRCLARMSLESLNV